MLQCQRVLVQRGIPLPDDLFRVDVFRVQPLGLFEFSQRRFPVALLGIGISQVSVDNRTGRIEPFRLAPTSNRFIHFALLFGAFAQAHIGFRTIRVEPQRFVQFLLR